MKPPTRRVIAVRMMPMGFALHAVFIALVASVTPLIAAICNPVRVSH